MAGIINPHRFASGGGGAPDINVKYGATNIANGGSHTVSPNPTEGDPDTVVFTVQNTGGADLIIYSVSNGTLTTVDYSPSYEFTSSGADTSTIAASGSDTLTVTFTPTADGSFSFDMEIN